MVLFDSSYAKNNVEQMLMQNEEMMSQTRRLETVHEKVDSYLKEYNHQKIYLVLVLTILALLLVFFYTLYHISVQKRRWRLPPMPSCSSSPM